MFKYNVNENYDFPFDERGNTFLALRKVTWGNGDEKLDLRKWYTNSDGKETVGKGFTFLTEEGPNELTKVLLDNGFGHTDEVINSIKDRKDFKKSLSKILDKSEDKIINELQNVDEEYYDPNILLKENV